jgi:glucose-1-phosphatase
MDSLRSPRLCGKMKIMSTKLVVFDLGRVLVRICDGWQHACQVAGVPVPDAMDDAGKAALFGAVCDSEVGKTDLDGFARAASGHLRLTCDQVKAISNVYLLGPYSGAAELLNELRQAGLSAACLSNTNENHWRIMTDPDGEYHAVFRHLNHQFASHRIGARKPDESIYEHVEQTSGVESSQIVFFDDLGANIDAARKRGWDGCLVDQIQDPVPQIRSYLRKIKVL